MCGGSIITKVIAGKTNGRKPTARDVWIDFDKFSEYHLGKSHYQPPDDSYPSCRKEEPVGYEDHSKAVHIGLCSDGQARHPLGSQVTPRSSDEHLLVAEIYALDLRQPKTSNFRAEFRVQQDVLRPYIAVYDFLVVQIINPLCRSQGYVEAGVLVQDLVLRF